MKGRKFLVNRNTRTIVKVAGIILVTVICSVAAYYVSSMAVGHQLATASNNMNYSRWQSKFFNLTAAVGGLTGFCSLLWFIMSRFVFKIDSAFSAGRRTFWAILAALSLVGSILIPRFYSVSLGIRVDGVVMALFVFFFTVLGYWLLSIFTTPKSFKYTPVGAQLFIRS